MILDARQNASHIKHPWQSFCHQLIQTWFGTSKDTWKKAISPIIYMHIWFNWHWQLITSSRVCNLFLIKILNDSLNPFFYINRTFHIYCGQSLDTSCNKAVPPRRRSQWKFTFETKQTLSLLIHIWQLDKLFRI